ncbi:glycosyl hydrolase family 43 [Bifidobacterium sp. UTCIF-39]|uniref:glycosyl hydrolase family 43 n=1 Tax=Bifidobacterium sp. UTCIF-39 TaxID=1465359 RepID=UPI00112E0AB6|nr:glycosyl hydrolase family 43 [Bifidobacterium sp. UTCIF-39]TPF97103.1 glycosyl hydrolase family 43 [Bifidobacterium sp. UTCIF-39]
MTHSAIFNGAPWFDDEGRPVNAHGACIVEDAGVYYLLGEYKTDDRNHFIGFSCYSSPDLVHWHVERLALPMQADGPLGPDRIGERVKVMRCPSTGKFVMFAHADDLGYRDPLIVVAVSDTVNGEYQLLGPLDYQGQPIRRWDMGTFQDTDGTGYLLLHEGDIFRLSNDYLHADELVAHEIAPDGESPAMTRMDDGTYAIMFSNKTSWDRNDNYYLTAPSPSGPWTFQGTFAPEGTCTWNSQCSFIFPLTLADGRTVPMYMGDRWSFPHQVSCASQVWLPLVCENGRIALPEYMETWDPRTGNPLPWDGQVLDAALDSDVPGDETTVRFQLDDERRLALIGNADRTGGYAQLDIADDDGTVFSSLVDCYTPTRNHGLLFVSPPLRQGAYTATVRVTGDASVFYKKDGTRLGSQGTRVSIAGMTLLQD